MTVRLDLQLHRFKRHSARDGSSYGRKETRILCRPALNPSKIKVTLLLKLRVDPAAAALTPLFAPAGASQTTTPMTRRGGGLPLDTELVWEYRIDPSTGLIVQHSILEIRINGQPSPAEVVSGWFRKAMSLTERDENQSGIQPTC
jgi:hypothetical protein